MVSVASSIASKVRHWILRKRGSGRRHSAGTMMFSTAVAGMLLNPADGLYFDGRLAHPPPWLPAPVQFAVKAGNQMQTQPYRRGGGHSNSNVAGYDCSGSVSQVLMGAGLLGQPLSSAGFANYGEPGPGRWITLFVRPGSHVFMSVCGLRLDTTGPGGTPGPRWRAQPRDYAGFQVRHPPGF